MSYWEVRYEYDVGYEEVLEYALSQYFVLNRTCPPAVTGETYIYCMSDMTDKVRLTRGLGQVVQVGHQATDSTCYRWHDMSYSIVQ